MGVGVGEGIEVAVGTSGGVRPEERVGAGVGVAKWTRGGVGVDVGLGVAVEVRVGI